MPRARHAPPARCSLASAHEPAPSALDVEGLHFDHPGRSGVLRGVSMRLPRGQVTAVVGPSGVGKSTLLGLLNGLQRPRSGRLVHAQWGDLTDPAAMREHRRHTATIFQDPALIDRLGALDNVLLGLADRRSAFSLLPWPRALQRRAAQALDEVGLLAHAHQPVWRLSGGERQRVGVARALVREPQLLLGDEPFASVDPTLAAQLGRQLCTLAAERGLTVVLVMHQLELARQFADRIVGLRGGRVVFDGPSDRFDERDVDTVFGA